MRNPVAWKGSSQALLGDKEITRLTGRSCGELPGIGRTLPSRHLRNPLCRAGEPGRSVCVRLIGQSAAITVGSACPRNHPSSGSCRRHCDPCELLFAERSSAPLVASRHTPELPRSGPDNEPSDHRSATVPHASSDASSPVAHPRVRSDNSCCSRERCNCW